MVNPSRSAIRRCEGQIQENHFPDTIFSRIVAGNFHYTFFVFVSGTPPSETGEAVPPVEREGAGGRVLVLP